MSSSAKYRCPKCRASLQAEEVVRARRQADVSVRVRCGACGATVQVAKKPVKANPEQTQPKPSVPRASLSGNRFVAFLAVSAGLAVVLLGAVAVYSPYRAAAKQDPDTETARPNPVPPQESARPAGQQDQLKRASGLAVRERGSPQETDTPAVERAGQAKYSGDPLPAAGKPSTRLELTAHDKSTSDGRIQPPKNAGTPVEQQKSANQLAESKKAGDQSAAKTTDGATLPQDSPVPQTSGPFAQETPSSSGGSYSQNYSESAPRLTGDALKQRSQLVPFEAVAPPERLRSAQVFQIKGKIKFEGARNVNDLILTWDSTKRISFEEIMPTPKADILFVLDLTGSMQFAIDGVKLGLQNFAARLKESKIDARIGLLGFRDIEADQRTRDAFVVFFGGQVLQGDLPTFLQFQQKMRDNKQDVFTADFDTFGRLVGMLKASGGGDEPESSLQALIHASNQGFREGASRVIVLITDAPPKLAHFGLLTETVPFTVQALKNAGIDQLHIVTKTKHVQNLTNPAASFQPFFAAFPTSSTFNDIAAASTDRAFAGLLPKLSQSISVMTVGERGVPSTDGSACLVLLGQHGWHNERGKGNLMDEKDSKRQRDKWYPVLLANLSMLTEDGIELKRLDDQQIRGTRCFGVLVKRPGNADIHLYFDQKSRLLFYAKCSAVDLSGKNLLHEFLFGDYRNFDGINHWTALETWRDGKKYCAITLSNVKSFDDADATIFVPKALAKDILPVLRDDLSFVLARLGRPGPAEQHLQALEDFRRFAEKRAGHRPALADHLVKMARAKPAARDLAGSVRALAALRLPSDNVLAVMEDGFRHADFDIRVSAALGLAQLGLAKMAAARKNELLGCFRKALKEPAAFTRIEGARGIAALGEEAAEALPDLLPLLAPAAAPAQDELSLYAVRAIQALGRVGEPAVPALARYVDGPRSSRGVIEAAALLYRLDPHNAFFAKPQAVDLLVHGLRPDAADFEDRLARPLDSLATRALLDMGPRGVAPLAKIALLDNDPKKVAQHQAPAETCQRFLAYALLTELAAHAKGNDELTRALKANQLRLTMVLAPQEQALAAMAAKAPGRTPQLLELYTQTQQAAARARTAIAALK